MLGRLLAILNGLVAMPSSEVVSRAQAEQNYRNIVWTERQNGEAIRNVQRLEWFCGVSTLLSIPRVPEWMGPWPKSRLAPVACAASSQPTPELAPERKPLVHLVSTSKKTVAK